MFHRVRAAFLAAGLALLVAGCGAAIAPQLHNDADRVPLARRYYDQHEYSLAADVLTGYTTTGTGAADIDQAVYLLGLVNLKQRDWAAAQAQFERVTRDYPESDSAGAARYRLGESLFGQSRDADFDQEFTLKAMAQWQAFLTDAPDDPWAPSAREAIARCRARLARKLWRTGDLYVKQKYYEPALVYFRSVMNDYADTPVLGDALMGLAVADAKLGRKDTALVVLDGLAKQFDGQALGLRASALRARVAKWPAEGDTRHRRHRALEAPTPSPQTATPSSTSTPFTP